VLCKVWEEWEVWVDSQVWVVWEVFQEEWEDSQECKEWEDSLVWVVKMMNKDKVIFHKVNNSKNQQNKPKQNDDKINPYFIS
jgi:hypothetical protein